MGPCRAVLRMKQWHLRRGPSCPQSLPSHRSQLAARQGLPGQGWSGQAPEYMVGLLRAAVGGVAPSVSHWKIGGKGMVVRAWGEEGC